MNKLLKLPFSKIFLDYKTFLKKKTPRLDDHFGVYCISGFQGTGKTYYAVNLARDIDLDGAEIWTNIHSLKLPHHNFSKIEEITSDFTPHRLYIIDEISSKYTKETRTDQKFYRWLQQTRKRQSIVIMITQEWKEVPTWLRRPVSVQITTHETLFSWLGFYKVIWGDGKNLTYDKDEGEYMCPPLRTVITKRNKKVAELYDTLEPVPDL